MDGKALVVALAAALGAAAVASAAGEAEKGFVPLFNGKDLSGWQGSTKGYVVEDGTLVCLKRGGGQLYTEKDYSDFILRFDFQLTPGANNGLAIRNPPGGHAAYQGMELQIIDNTAKRYRGIRPWQKHGSIYGVVPAETGHLEPVGQWNSQEVIARGPHITVILNGATIVDTDLTPYIEGEKNTADGKGVKGHPGLKRTGGRIGFLGHGSRVAFRNIRIKELAKKGQVTRDE
ncbi:MAG: DUF1080 domain-containing protein [Candidatus Brocadiia bacterium]